MSNLHLPLLCALLMSRHLTCLAGDTLRKQLAVQTRCDPGPRQVNESTAPCQCLVRRIIYCRAAMPSSAGRGMDRMLPALERVSGGFLTRADVCLVRRLSVTLLEARGGCFSNVLGRAFRLKLSIVGNSLPLPSGGNDLCTALLICDP